MSPSPPRPAIGSAAPLFGLRSVQGGAVDLAAYRGHLNVVLWFSRGFKYTPAGGRVTVSVTAAPAVEPSGAATVTIRVVDTGIGIRAHHLPHLFDKFYRVKDTATQGILGTGLGLAITKSIVESHGGRIGVESTEGVGSVFSVELPECPPS